MKFDNMNGILSVKLSMVWAGNSSTTLAEVHWEGSSRHVANHHQIIITLRHDETSTMNPLLLQNFSCALENHQILPGWKRTITRIK